MARRLSDPGGQLAPVVPFLRFEAEDPIASGGKAAALRIRIALSPKIADIDMPLR
jgi:hypothetical protein